MEIFHLLANFFNLLHRFVVCGKGSPYFAIEWCLKQSSVYFSFFVPGHFFFDRSLKHLCSSSDLGAMLRKSGLPLEDLGVGIN